MGTMEHPQKEFSSPNETLQDADGVVTQTFSTKQNGTSLKPCFKRRSSMTAEPTSLEKAEQMSAEEPSTTSAKEGQPPEIVDPFAHGVTTRLCGPSRSKCGYCDGTRRHVLEVDDGHNKVLKLREKCDYKASIGNNTCTDVIDEENTSKSYGLIFDYLPYDTYQQLIDRGWRRSGRHLYRPHNFESCCPAISIRLDTTKFASYKSTSNDTDIERSILVGGSKSQRRVGRNLLRALEKYNAKCQCADKNGSDIERVNNGTAIAAANVEFTNSTTHLNKKSRRGSPLHQEDLTMKTSQQIQEVTCSKNTTIEHIIHVLKKSEQELLHQLAQISYQTVTDRVIKLVDSHERPKWAWWNDDGSIDENIPKWCSFKFTSNNLAKAKVEDSAQFASSMFIMASTSICTASSGRSRELADRNELAEVVLESLKAYLSDDAVKNKSMLELHSVGYHEMSGHIQIIFKLPPHYMSKVSFDTKSKPLSASKVRTDEPFTEFISRYHSKNEQLTNLTETQTKSFHDKQLHLVVRTVPVFESSLQPEVHRLFCNYQTATHGDDDPFLCDDTDNTYEEFDGEYKYYLEQKSVGFLDIDAVYSHLSAKRRSKIKKSYLSFYRFLCETPLKHEVLKKSSTNNINEEASLEDGYDVRITRGGTYHQQYRLCTSKDSFDGPLIAVGVVDILPDCMSSVYAFYDPCLSAKLELGKYTALREIEWVRRAKWITHKNYYLGYYIHSCQKMIYKAEYKPSELLCPVHFKWVDFEIAKKKLETKSPVRHSCALYEKESSEYSATEEMISIENIVLDIGAEKYFGGSSLLTVNMLSREGRTMIDSAITEFANEVGPELARKMIVKLS